MSWLRSKWTRRAVRTALRDFSIACCARNPTTWSGTSLWSASACSPASSPAALASSALATSSSSRFDKHPTLGECCVERGAGCVAPFLDLSVAVDQNVDRSAQVVQGAAEAHHLGVPVEHVGL